jgi:hypothetical protein
VVLVALSAVRPLGPTRALASPGHDPIYRLKISITTTAQRESLFLLAPSLLIDGKVTRRPARSGSSAYFGSFGSGPLSLTQRSGGHKATATYVVALTPSSASRLRFLSSKSKRGRTTIHFENSNAGRPTPIRSFVHRAGGKTSRDVYVGERAVSARGPVPGTQPLAPKVYAFYYQWYSLQDWQRPRIASYNNNDRPYSSADPDTISRHIKQARGAGINGFISSWWGKGTRTGDNFKILMSALPASGFKAAVYFETLAPAFSTKHDVVQELEYVLDTYGGKPGYLTIGGNPVIYFYATNFVLRGPGQPANPAYLSVWRSIFSKLRKDGYRFEAIGDSLDAHDLSVFGGLHLYGARGNYGTDREMSLSARAYAAIHGGQRRIWGAPVAPGYDDRQIPGRHPTKFIARDRGNVYKAQWAGATSSASDQALIVTFNEWYETTNIEPNRRWGTQYLQITKERAGAFKNSR